MNNELLVIKNVSLSFDNGKTYILRDINFNIESGEIVSIIGLNGSGKTSLLKIIAGIYKPTSGTIIRNYKRLSYIPQKLEIDKTFPMSTIDFISVQNAGVLVSEINKYLKKFNIEYLENRKISDLSGGELQKILIISGLISNPEIILLDEPTASIDVTGVKLFYEVIHEIKNVFRELTIILVSHNIQMVYKNSDKVICLHENNFCCHGTPEELQNNKIINEIFNEYMSPYVHNPHEKHE